MNIEEAFWIYLQRLTLCTVKDLRKIIVLDFFRGPTTTRVQKYKTQYDSRWFFHASSMTAHGYVLMQPGVR
ncbi:hypothetical protein WG66_014199 [Moniliophthora roreri]|nr:hypothetical protein WG66_014199 [Moniliophthora roreri]